MYSERNIYFLKRDTYASVFPQPWPLFEHRLITEKLIPSHKQGPPAAGV